MKTQELNWFKNTNFNGYAFPVRKYINGIATNKVVPILIEEKDSKDLKDELIKKAIDILNK